MYVVYDDSGRWSGLDIPEKEVLKDFSHELFVLD